MLLNETFLERFWIKVDIPQDLTDCWEWTAATAGGSKNDDGYGRIRVNGQLESAHRLSWEISKGELIPDGMWVLHNCHNTLCVNPTHLRLGTRQENIKDAVENGILGKAIKGVTQSKKRRMAQSKRQSTLRECEIWLVKKLLTESQLTHKEIASIFKVSYRIISDISRGRTGWYISYP